MTQDATETDLQRLDALRDEDIDYSDIPELDAELFRQAHVVGTRKQQPPTRAASPPGLKGRRRGTNDLTR